MVKFRENLIFAYSAIPLFRYSVFRVLLTPNYKSPFIENQALWQSMQGFLSG